MSEPVRLSESHLWDDLREFYETEGVKVWSSDHLPFFATNNPALAKTYVDLFVAYVDDCLEAGLIDTQEPVVMVELGGGMGRLAYLILVRLRELADRIPVNVRYLLTDYGQSNVDSYLVHEKFTPFLECGALEVQRFDAENEQLDLKTKNPVFAIANYLFDSLSQDGFRVHNGVLSEAKCAPDPKGRARFSFTPVTSGPYGIESYDRVLENYRCELGNTHVPFPIGPLRCLNSLSESAHGRFALVMADKALRTKEELLDFETLPIERHNRGFSMSVNCHAIDQVWQADGGFALHSCARENHLNLAFYGKGVPLSQARRAYHIFVDQVDGFGPLDYLDFRDQVLSFPGKRSLMLYIQLLRLSNWDAEFFYEISNRLGEASLVATIEEKQVLYGVMTRCWANFFPIPDDRDVPFAVARVLACINQFHQAIGFYGESIRLYGPKALTHHNVGICHFNLGQLEAAKAAFEAALAVDKDYGPSKELLLRTKAEQQRQDSLKP
jgi:tetratricopeptide (TPR) repeat protein